MKHKDKSLEEQYQEVFKDLGQRRGEEESNLEQPYFGRIVETVTKYSVTDVPEFVQKLRS